ncbi:MAG: hypothetical protein ABJA78_02505 [Ferruginibacter sp.]
MIIALLAQTFNRFAIQLDYLFNTTAYTKNCENKAIPKMHCNGKCQMMKKMQEQEKKDQQLPERKQGKFDEVLSSKSFFYTITIVPVNIIKSVTSIISEPVIDRSFAFFHPPQYS